VQAHGYSRQLPHVEIDGGDLPQGQVHQGQLVTLNLAMLSGSMLRTWLTKRDSTESGSMWFTSLI